LINFLFHAADC